MIRVLMLCAVLASALPVDAQVKNGQAAPELSLPDTSGLQVRLSSFKGKAVLIDFWASWCMPCRMNNPRLVRLYQKYQSRGFEILGVSIDTKLQDWKRAILKDRLTWPQVVDDGGWNAKSTLVYGVDAIPASYLLDRNGIVRGVNLDGRTLETALERILAEK